MGRRADQPDEDRGHEDGDGDDRRGSKPGGEDRDETGREDHRGALGDVDRAEPHRADVEDVDDERQEQHVDRAQAEHRDGERDQRRQEEPRVADQAQALEDRRPDTARGDTFGVAGLADRPAHAQHQERRGGEGRRIEDERGPGDAGDADDESGEALPITPAMTRVA